MLPGRRAQSWRHQPAFRRPRHFHEEPEINLVVRGGCVLGVGDRELRLAAGEGLLFQPGQDHVLYEASDDLDLFVMALSPALADRVVGFRALASSRRDVFRVFEPESARAELTGLASVADGQAAERRLADLFARTLRRSSSAHVVSRRAIELAHDDPTLSGAAVARRLGTASSQVSRRVHAELGVPLVEYRARVKLMRFVELVDSGRPLTGAALDAGFGSYAQCHRVFRRALGCSPQQYFTGARAAVDQQTASSASASPQGPYR
jgi:AraC-like DNA-binding protein